MLYMFCVMLCVCLFVLYIYDTQHQICFIPTAPVARDDSAQVSSGDDLAFVSVLVNDTPAAGQTLSVKSITSVASNGECSIGLDLTEVVYVPNDGFSGTDKCTYEACDAVPVCATATVTFTVG